MGLPPQVPVVPFRTVFADTDAHHDAVITTATALGVHRSRPTQVREAVNASGMVHLPLVSGFHVAPVYWEVLSPPFRIQQVRY
jgi:hypothetical protein